MTEFTTKLTISIRREIEAVFILPLHGRETVLNSVEQAIIYIEGYDDSSSGLPIVNYVVEVRCNIGERIEGRFVSKDSAITFLREYLPSPVVPVEE